MKGGGGLPSSLSDAVKGANPVQLNRCTERVTQLGDDRSEMHKKESPLQKYRAEI